MSRRSFRKKLIPKPYKSWYEFHISEWLLKNKVPFEYEQYQFTYYPTISKGVCLDCNSKNVSRAAIYTPDWFLPDQNIFIETKGVLSQTERKKLKAVHEQCPDLNLHILLERNAKIKGSKKWEYYGDWCDWAEIPWGVGKQIPEDWLKTEDTE